MELKCTTCRVSIFAKDNFVRFNCPDCGKVEVVRCKNCKILSNKYICKECGFAGP